MNLDILLPARIFQATLPDLLRVLGRGDASGITQVTLDFSTVKFYEPVALVSLLAKVLHWNETGKTVKVSGHDTGTASGYLARMGIFAELQAPFADGRTYRDSNGRFVVLQIIDGATDCDRIAGDVSNCVITSNDDDSVELRRIIAYAIGELVKNCQQHSRSRGYLLAQFFPNTGMVHVAIADAGRGIVASYRDNLSPRYRDGMTDEAGLLEALKLESSSTTHRRSPVTGELSPNRGIGLTMSRALTGVAYGDFLLCSGDALIVHDTVHAETAAPVNVAPFHGVSCGLTFTRSALKRMTYLEVLTDVKVKLGLMPDTDTLPPENLFQP